MGDGMNKVSTHPDAKKWKPPKGPKPIARKNKNTIGLGRSIANQRRLENEVSFLPDGDIRFTTDKKQADWIKLKSVTQENSLDEFLNTAELADTDFTADRRNQVKIIKVGNNSIADQDGLLTVEERNQVKKKHDMFENRLKIPRRPKWSKNQSRLEIQRQENLAFLNWRRDLASLTENNDLLLTPFERNIEVWRQLWRVIERSDLVVQIVDARNPLLFRSIDLVKYVGELSDTENNRPKRNLLLVNKADLLSLQQRKSWSGYFKEREINYVFFSAAKANELLEKEKEEIKESLEEDVVNHAPLDGDVELDNSLKIISVNELENLFLKEAPKFEFDPEFPQRKTNVGLVGYPNVGKSSTINALVGSKKVSVSSTPGKTKHFQTVHLTDDIILFDCPGLVFPNFAYTNADLVCNGILPIDQLREHIPPISLTCQRIPKFYLEAVYGIHISSKSAEDGGSNDFVSARELLNAYARARGFVTQGFGSSDEPRASRYILKDYVSGKLLFVNPPPKLVNGTWESPSLDESREYNKELYTLSSLPESRRKQIVASMNAKALEVDEFDLSKDLKNLNFSMHRGENGNSGGAAKKSNSSRGARIENESDDLDTDFFELNRVGGKLSSPFHKQESFSTSKKHNKRNKKSKK